MKSAYLQKGTDRRRRCWLLAGCAAPLLLGASLWFALSARGELSQVMHEVRAGESRERELMRLREEYANWRSYQAQAEAFERQVVQADLAPRDWRRRELTVDRAKMPRWKAQAYLSSLVSSEGYYFLPERFELKVLYESDDLLRWRDGSTNELEMTLVGHYFIRGEQ